MARLLSHTLIVVGLAGALALGGCSDADQPAFIERGDAARAGNAEGRVTRASEILDGREQPQIPRVTSRRTVQ